MSQENETKSNLLILGHDRPQRNVGDGDTAVVQCTALKYTFNETQFMLVFTVTNKNMIKLMQELHGTTTSDNLSLFKGGYTITLPCRS